MKTRFLKMNRLAGPLPATLTLGAVLLLGALAPSQAQTGSPVGSTWDCLLSGKRNGIAYLTFSTNNNGTISGYEILVPQPLISPHVSLIADVLGDNGLGFRPQPTNSNTTTNIFGYFPITGSWGFDRKGQIIGTFLEVASSENCLTNIVPATTNTYVSLVPVSETNAFAGGFCVTLPLSTNMIADSYIEQMTCYAAFVVTSSNSFQSFERIEATNTFPDGHFCITAPIATNAGYYVEAMTCYAPTAPVSTNSFPSMVAYTNVVYSDGVLCETVPVTTNMVPAGYLEQMICYVNQLDCPGTLTNAVNFTGKAVPLKRLTLTCKTSLGTVTMRGVPAVNLIDLSGLWYGVKKQKGTTWYEFLSLTNSLIEPNTYWVDGSGAGYTYFGVAGLSSKKKIALAFTVLNIDGNYQSTRAVVGSFNPKKLSGNTTGLDTPGGPTAGTNRCTFQVTRRPSRP
jgi:hypothetical protein